MDYWTYKYRVERVCEDGVVLCCGMLDRIALGCVGKTCVGCGCLAPVTDYSPPGRGSVIWRVLQWPWQRLILRLCWAKLLTLPYWESMRRRKQHKAQTGVIPGSFTQWALAFSYCWYVHRWGNVCMTSWCISYTDKTIVSGKNNRLQCSRSSQTQHPSNWRTETFVSTWRLPWSMKACIILRDLISRSSLF